MTSERIVVDVNDLETQEEHVEEIGSGHSRPLPLVQALNEKLIKAHMNLKCKLELIQI